MKRTCRLALASVVAATIAPSLDVFAASTDAAQIAARVSVFSPVTAVGQTATLLPDGRWLLLGGDGSGTTRVRATAQWVDLRGGKSKTTVLPATLAHARSGHTATVLPDGSVLILGGLDETGATLSIAERFHPDTGTFETLGNLGLLARSRHTATLLMSGELLIAGGLDVRGRATDQAELFDPASRAVESFNARLDQARFAHLAALLPSGDVFIWNGLNAERQSLDTGELFGPDSGQFTLAASNSIRVPQQDYGSVPAQVVATLPAADALGVALDARLAIRFSKPLLPETVNAQSVTLVGPGGPVELRVFAAEGGLLAFATPAQQLLPATSYTLFVNGCKDDVGHAVPFLATAFTTETVGAASSTGRSKTIGVAGGIAQPGAAAAPLPLPPASAAEPAAIAADDDEVWTPGPKNYHGDWQSHRHQLARQSLPHRLSALHAIQGNSTVAPTSAVSPEPPAGSTAVTGQLLRLNGKPLAGATLAVAGVSTTTDSNGEFMLVDIPSGTQTLVIDGSTADQGVRHYGRYEYLLKAQAGKTLALPFVIWMSRLDVKNDLRIASPTTAPTVLKNPSIPGLELRLPAGMVVRDAAGRIVTQLDMTAIPTDQAPFPLPNVPVPTYFTIQPGGAHLVALNSGAAQGAQLIYPNFTASKPGARIDFWNYDPREKGWYVYGQGTVTADGLQVMPDPGVVIYEFTGAMVALPGTAPPNGPPCNCKKAQHGDPVDDFTGLFVQNRIDLVVNDVLPIEVGRVYRPRDDASRAFGIGTNLGYDMFLVGDVGPWTYQDLILPDGGRVHYTRTTAGTSFVDAVFTALTTPGPYFGSTIVYGEFTNGGVSGWTLRLKDGTRIAFPDAYQAASARLAAMDAVQDRYGNQLTFVRDSARNLTQIISPHGRSIYLTYDNANRITDATDDIGRNSHYAYDGAGRLVTATDVAGNSETYTYDSLDRMLTVVDRRGNRMVLNDYDDASRVRQQTYADNTTYRFNYTLDVNQNVAQVDATDERGVVERTTFDAAGTPLSVTYALGRPEQERITYVVDPATELVTSQSDQHGRTTGMLYDAMGNVRQLTVMQSTANAETWTYSYDPGFNELLYVTDPLQRGVTVTPDALGNPQTITDTLGHAINLGFDGAGRVASLTRDSGNHPFTATLGYTGADLTSVVDPLNRTVTATTDDVGRAQQVNAPLGMSASMTYDAFDRTLTNANALAQSTGVSYDGNGNLTTFTDGLQHVTRYDHDARNRLIAKTDALGRVERYTYDAAGHLATVLDRKGQLKSFSYDGLGRVTRIGYGATAAAPTAFKSTTTVAYAWAGPLLTVTVTDSIAGTSVFKKDAFDRLQESSTPQGIVDYTYYANGLRNTMTVAGQPTVTYTWDAANRLTQIQQAAGAVNNNTVQTIGLGYDNANRRTSTTLANGMKMVYGLDDGGQLQTITYLKADGATQFGTLNYGYDGAGRRSSQGGTLASLDTGTTSVASASFDADNKLTSTWGTTTPSYDNNGNMTGDGTRVYNWNERDQLTSIVQGATTIATFQYDVLGRRVVKTINATTTGFLYDGWNVVQELAAGTTNADHSNFRANLLNGLRLDERYLRIAGTGATGIQASFLTDALGSTIALTNPDGSVEASYTYQPYGATTQVTPVGQVVSDNSFQYTGRENDVGTGIYYYRARYLNSQIGRFLQEDPAGLIGGQNKYVYAKASPIGNVDPTGNCPPCLVVLIPVAEALGVEISTLVAGSVVAADVAGSVATGAISPVGGAADVIEQQVARGGVYLMRDLETGVVVRTGRTCDLLRREREHARALLGYSFEAQFKTDSYAEQRGLEQLLFEQYPGAEFNYVSPIAQSNNSYDFYIMSALDSLGL